MIPKRILRQLKKKKVFLQLPEGLKTKAIDICRELEEHGFECVISGDLCFGACDIKKMAGAVTLHIGHSKMLDEKGIVYYEWPMKTFPEKITRSKIKKLPKTIGLCTTVQHIHDLNAYKNTLESFGKKVYIIPKGKRTTYKGQVLGCDFSGATKIKEKVDAFVFVGTGLFHAIGLAYYTKKQTFKIDPYSGNVEGVGPEKWIRESALRKTKAWDAKHYGIIVSTKPGQKNWKEAMWIKKRLESRGKEAYIIVMDNITPELLLPYNVDAFVITACPRIVIDDWRNYSKAILLPEELD
ncbi:MAG: diphthamide biosynthesis enzyme Dph2 [Candidatus Diapherotrites archaeon]|nr:diphthamide biosynthesis enzyme Dph2 [Candidatus Diapherotrites archaeon]